MCLFFKLRVINGVIARNNIVTNQIPWQLKGQESVYTDSAPIISFTPGFGAVFMDTNYQVQNDYFKHVKYMLEGLITGYK